MTRAWIMFQSGSKIDLLNPRSDAWTDRDLAVGMSRTNRWGGHSAWDYPLSVAQHSLAVLAIREAMPGRPLTAGEALRELLHDAPEALMGGLDIITPLKPILGDAFRALDTRLQAAVNRRYDLPPWTVVSHREHKQADHQAAANEALHVVGWRRPALRKTLGIEIAPMEHDPLDLPDAMVPWEPWPPYVAADRFLAKLKALQKARGEACFRRAAA